MRPPRFRRAASCRASRPASSPWEPPLHAVNPATGERLAEHPAHDDAELTRRLDAAAAAFAPWRDAGIERRAAVLNAAAAALRAGAAGFARLMTAEMGKPITQSLAEVEKCAATCAWFARHGAELLASEEIASEAIHSRVDYEPLGVVLAVMPWNFPFWQAIRCAAPALIAGNVVALKHASQVPGSAMALERLFHDAGAPQGVFTTLLIDSERVRLAIDHAAVRAVSLTGSDAAGEAVAAHAGRALKKCVLELGGSDPFIVLDDVDPVFAAGRAAAARTINSGQSCIAAKRFLVDAAVAPAFEAALAAAMRSLRVGDPLDPATEVGPLARAELRDQLHDQVRRAIAAGARLVVGGEPVAGPGCWYAPTVLADVAPGNPAFDEETFGPVAALTPFRDDDEAVALANASRYGLGASVWTADRARGERLAARLEAGSVFVNELVKSDPRLPFGGVKHSGYGRELSRLGVREFVNAKTLWLA